MLRKMIDWLLTTAELVARQIYWRRRARREGRTTLGNPAVPPRVPQRELEERLRNVAGASGGLLMVHSSLGGFTIVDERGEVVPAGQAAAWIIHVLTDALGSQGTLCMPTHPLYRDSPGFMFDKSELVLAYSVRTTPSSVGLVTEFFRRQAGVRRSLHPLSSLAMRGPLAEELLADNLNDREPLPHGVDSGYFRFCQRGGLVLGLGVSLVKTGTVFHVGEDARDREWPIAGFFYRRRFEIEDESGAKRMVTVRERRPEFVRGCALGRYRRDLLSAGILEEGRLSGMRLETASAARVYAMLREKQQGTSYPYYWAALSRWGRPPRAGGRGDG